MNQKNCYNYPEFSCCNGNAKHKGIYQMVKVEFHCHTIYSKDSLMQPEVLVESCRQKGIDRVIITDHNEILGAQLAQQIDPQRVIVGEEIMTTRGEILAAFVTERVPPG